MRKWLIIAIISIAPMAGAQEMKPLPAPSEVKLAFTTKGGQHQFHLGEPIPTKYSYTADLPGRYILVSLNHKLWAGRGLEVRCSPEVWETKKLPTFSDGGDIFEKMLNSCPGYGFGAGQGGGCGDCDDEYPLNAVPINFEIPLNAYVRFTSAGVYECIASSADITNAPREEKIRPALLVQSEPLELTIVDDPAWANRTALALGEAYDKLCRGDDVAQNRFLQCSDIAQRIIDLDTLDTLSLEVRLFDGKNRGWSNGFWDAIQQTSYPKEAIRLLTEREQAPDVLVSVGELESLAIGSLKIDSPSAFDTASPKDYHSQAVEKLREYVRLLGRSLAKKNTDVLPESLKTYLYFAEQDYCEGAPLIPDEERKNVLASAGSPQKQ